MQSLSSGLLSPVLNKPLLGWVEQWGLIVTVDLGAEPWIRMSRLAPAGCTETELQEAADRYETTNDYRAALADIWEEYANQFAPNPPDGDTAGVASVSQDGVSVTYTNVASEAALTYSAYLSIATRHRAKSKPVSLLLGGPTNRRDVFKEPSVWADGCDPDETFIEVSNWDGV